MEIEAWFLAEYNHFPVIHPSITVEVLQTTFGFNPQTDDMQARLEPADDMVRCYGIGGQTYQKGNAEQTVNAMNYEYVYMGLVERIPYLQQFVGLIEAFLAA